MLAKKIGEQDYKEFIKETNLLNTPEFDSDRRTWRLL